MDLQSRRNRLDQVAANGFNFLLFSDSSPDEESPRLNNLRFWLQDVNPKIQGLPHNKIENLGEFIWKNEYVVETARPGSIVLRKKEALCSVCMANLQTGDNARKLKCGHFFHKECIDCWLRIKGTCPLDRVKI